MIKVSVLYPWAEGARFDFDYYATQHADLVVRQLGDALLKVEVDKGVSSAAEGTAPIFVAALHLYFAGVDAFRASFGPHAGTFRADMVNYTDLKPSVQISEVATRD